MGNWSLTIQGTGIHHNGRNDDIDAVARQAVRFIASTDFQTVTSATLTTGGTENVADVLGHEMEHPAAEAA